MTAAVRSSDESTSELANLARIFDELRDAAFDGVGISRLAYTQKETDALDIIEAEARKIGLVTERDAAANLVATLPGSDPSLPFIACGSHLDSVPQGGNYDGAAGVGCRTGRTSPAEGREPEAAEVDQAVWLARRRKRPVWQTLSWLLSVVWEAQAIRSSNQS
jgi:acetylornithine deacetylase/succinyl-diaminopimelate desuccinylase-like protein